MNRINSPIEVKVTASTPQTATFHVLKLHVTASATGGTTGADVVLSDNAYSGKQCIFDISSALRAAADSIVFQPDTLTTPVVTYQCTYWEEWLKDGELIRSPQTGEATVPNGTGTALLGGYTDYERITNTKPTTNTRKPLTSIETVAVGDTFISSGAVNISGNQIAASPSIATPITQEGIQTVQGHTLYAVPQNRNRHQFRFINGLGAMESVSIECYADESVTYNTEQFQQTRPDYMGGISHTRIEKSLDIEQWKFSTGPLTREWRHWYAHEFLMSRHVWISLLTGEGRGGASWLPVLIIPEETTPLINRAATDLPSIDFTVKMNFQG